MLKSTCKEGDHLLKDCFQIRCLTSAIGMAIYNSRLHENVVKGGLEKIEGPMKACFLYLHSAR